jgi:hypothetical protein
MIQSSLKSPSANNKPLTPEPLVLYTSHKNVQNSSEYNFTGENSG